MLQPDPAAGRASEPPPRPRPLKGGKRHLWHFCLPACCDPQGGREGKGRHTGKRPSRVGGGSPPASPPGRARWAGPRREGRGGAGRGPRGSPAGGKRPTPYLRAPRRGDALSLSASALPTARPLRAILDRRRLRPHSLPPILFSDLSPQSVSQSGARSLARSAPPNRLANSLGPAPRPAAANRPSAARRSQPVSAALRPRRQRSHPTPAPRHVIASHKAPSRAGLPQGPSRLNLAADWGTGMSLGWSCKEAALGPPRRGHLRKAEPGTPRSDVPRPRPGFAGGGRASGAGKGRLAFGERRRVAREARQRPSCLHGGGGGMGASPGPERALRVQSIAQVPAPKSLQSNV